MTTVLPGNILIIRQQVFPAGPGQEKTSTATEYIDLLSNPSLQIQPQPTGGTEDVRLNLPHQLDQTLVKLTFFKFN